MELTTVGAALEILNKSWKALESIRERAQASKDITLKEGVGKLYDEFNSLRSVVIRLTDENTDLRRTISGGAKKPPEPEIRQVGTANYYFVGDKGPYCQPCYDVTHALVNLTPQTSYAAGTGRTCLVCKTLFIEVAASPRSMQIRPYMG
jgi:hypothetical protein